MVPGNTFATSIAIDLAGSEAPGVRIAAPTRPVPVDLSMIAPDSPRPASNGAV
jgi:hypothetical protein